MRLLRLRPSSEWTQEGITGASYLSRYVRRSRKRQSKEPASSWNLSKTAVWTNYGYRSCVWGAASVRKTVDETVKVSFKREKSSTLRVRHGCLHTHTEVTLTSFVETFLVAAQLELVCATAPYNWEFGRLYHIFVPSLTADELQDKTFCFIEANEQNDLGFDFHTFPRILFIGLSSVIEWCYIHNLKETQGKTAWNVNLSSWSASGVHSFYITVHTTPKNCLRDMAWF